MTRAPLLDTYAQLPIRLVSGHGARVRDADGREYWDFYGGHAVALLGHAHPAVARAVAEQAARLTFYSNVVPLDVRTRAAERLCHFAPPGLEHVFFCNSGAEANENALKLALKLTQRRRIAAVIGGWHGRSLLTLSATTDDKLTRPLDGLLCPAVRLRPNELADVSLLDESVAALILEPIQSIAGIVELRREFLRALRQRCTEVGALLIYDEVQTGMGRLGRPLAAGDHGVTPDMATLAKGIANGIPMAALLVSPALADSIKSGDLGSTFGGGPVACAALLAVLDEIQRENLVERAAELGRIMHDMLRVGPVSEVLGRGCLIGLRVRPPAAALHAALLQRGFITGTSADPGVVRLMPPINTPAEAVRELARCLQHSESAAHA
ncbi:MAG: [LysW]-aminoadipate semialdehyde transaminase [Phycisphaerae bacterium]|nr:[LysW]-aminoadipate semialdehyde transaminase [Phycisphaerae bacterium]